MNNNHKIKKNEEASPQCLKPARSRYSVSGGHSFCRRGFVILFAVTLSALLLAIALGISNIALKEVKFSTNAKDTNNAFFAADHGLEYALFQDKSGDICAAPCTLDPISIFLLGSEGKSCALVNVEKNEIETVVVSKGYSHGGSPSGECVSDLNNGVERQLEVRY